MNQTNRIPRLSHLEGALKIWTPYLFSVAARGLATTGARGMVFIVASTDEEMALKIESAGYFVPQQHSSCVEAWRQEGRFPDDLLQTYNPASEAVVGFHIPPEFFVAYTVGHVGKLQ